MTVESCAVDARKAHKNRIFIIGYNLFLQNQSGSVDARKAHKNRGFIIGYNLFLQNQSGSNSRSKSGSRSNLESRSIFWVKVKVWVKVKFWITINACVCVVVASDFARWSVSVCVVAFSFARCLCWRLYRINSLIYTVLDGKNSSKQAITAS